MTEPVEGSIKGLSVIVNTLGFIAATIAPFLRCNGHIFIVRRNAVEDYKLHCIRCREECDPNMVTTWVDNNRCAKSDQTPLLRIRNDFETDQARKRVEQRNKRLKK